MQDDCVSKKSYPAKHQGRPCPKRKRKRHRSFRKALGWRLKPEQIKMAFRSQKAKRPEEKPGEDPVKALRDEEKMERKRQLEEAAANEKKEEMRAQRELEEELTMKPSIGVRVELAKPHEYVAEEGKPRPKYVVPLSKTGRAEAAKRRKLAEIKRNFCKYAKTKVPKPETAAAPAVEGEVAMKSPEMSHAAVVPKKASGTPSSYPDPQSKSSLQLKKPKSGIFINETDKDAKKPRVGDYDSFDLVYRDKPRPAPFQPRKRYHIVKKKLPKKKKKKKRPSKELGEDAPELGSMTSEKIAQMIEIANKVEGEEQEGEGEEGGGDAYDNYLTKQFRRKVSLASKQTSLREKDLDNLPAYEDEDLEQIPVISRIVQKFRRASEVERYKPPLKEWKRGTLESHSFTKLEQKTLETFYFGSKCGTMHQGDEHFSLATRNLQGICMPVAAYCFAQLKHPKHWSESDMDEILEIGDRLYRESMEKRHVHDKRDLSPLELKKNLVLDRKRIRYEIYDPEISGMIRSDDERVYNLSKGLKLFFRRHRAGILQTYGVNILIWKDRHYYFYDATPRLNDMIPDEKGAARLANFYDVPSVATILLNRSRLGNWPYVISKISVVKLAECTDDEDDDQSDSADRTDYHILNEKKAVIQASFDLADLCFDFTRNKQAMAMAAVCLVYSRITPPSAWHRRTLDKIMIIGNQLYIECMKCDQLEGELRLDDLPAAFTLGPYLVEMHIYANRFADITYKKSECMFAKCLQDFFDKNTNAIVQIDKGVLAVWFQRNVYYCFDPYSRNNEGLLCRNGTACVVMTTDLETLVDTILANFDKRDAVFYIHALKVIKINRDPAQTALFPRNMTMNDYPTEKFVKCKMRKSRQAAIARPVTVDYTDVAVRRIHPTEQPGDSLLEIGSDVWSLKCEYLPPMMQKWPSRSVLRTNLPQCEKVADLDSPSLSDTQIVPRRPRPEDDEDLAGIDLDAFELTVEELELSTPAEGGEHGEGGGGHGEGGDGEGGEGGGGPLEGVDELDAYMAASIYSQVHPDSLQSYHSKLSVELNTEVTCGLLPLKREILPPTNIARKQRILRERQRERPRSLTILSEPTATQSEELAKESNFVQLPDGTQLVRGSTNISQYGIDDVEYLAPFVCIMAAAVAKKYSIVTWNGDIIDYVLKAGSELYKVARVRYDQVPKLEIPKVSLGKTDFSVKVDYVFDSYMKQNVLEMALTKMLYARSDCGILVTPSYACALFYKNHLYYLYEGFGCNELGMGEGPENTGTACFARFLDVHDLASRIMRNKDKREDSEQVEYTRFVLSVCTVRQVPRPEDEEEKHEPLTEGEEFVEDAGEGGEPPSPPPKEEEKSKTPRREPAAGEPKNEVGYQFHGGYQTIRGTTALTGRSAVTTDLKEDHFVCLCASLMLINRPIKKWDTKCVDKVVEQGRALFSHADDLVYACRRSIRNILIDKYYFDLIVRRIETPDWRLKRSLDRAIDFLFERKHAYFLLQFPNQCYVVHERDGFYHLFDPYPCKKDGKPSEGGAACWTMFKDLRQMKRRIKTNIVDGGESFQFYTFDVTAFKKAPKSVLLERRLHLYEMNKAKREENIGKTLHEDQAWLDVDPIPWSRYSNKTAAGLPRGRADNVWHNWEIEYKRDLFSITSTHHQTAERYEPEHQGKQTLCNLVTALAMTDLYELSDWNRSVMDSILISGDHYFGECVADLKDDDYELAFEDLKPDCNIYPYSFKVELTPVVGGTMFVLRAQQFNLYKALRTFFNGRDNRRGIVTAARAGEPRRTLAFAKIREKEYFAFDCEAYGPPMFTTGEGRAYALRMTSLNRLVHVLTMALRGGDFYVYEVAISDFRTIE